MIFLQKPDDFIVDFEAVGCFVEAEAKVLFLLRCPKAKIEPNKWGAPAGKVGKGEDPKTAMLRELFEEIGACFGQDQLHEITQVFIDYSFYSCRFAYHIFRLSLPFCPDIRLSHEHVAYAWIPINGKAILSLNLVKDEYPCAKLAYNLKP